MKKRVLLSGVFGAVALQAFCLQAVTDIAFKEAKGGVLDVPGDGTGEGVRCFSQPFAVKTGALYGFEYSGREVGSGLIVAGSDGVNVDRRGPDAGWYEYKHAYQTRDLPGATMKDKFHLGHYRGRGEFSFRDCRFRELKAVFGTPKGFTLGHGESVVGNRYRFDTALSSFGRNHARTLHFYRNASFNSTHWNNGGNSEVVYRFDLAGRTFQDGSASVTCAYYTGKDGLVIEASADGETWTEAGVAAQKGLTRVTVPAVLFPAKVVFVRLRGQRHTGLQVTSFSFEAAVDGEPVTAYGSTQYLDAETGKVFGSVNAPIFAEALSPKNAQLVSDGDGLALWGAVSDVKVFRGTPVPENRGRGVSLHLAGNERESVQLVVTPTGGELRNVTVTASDLVRKDGRLPASAVTVERVGYVRVEVPTDESGAPGLWPDPLLPQDAARPCGVGKNQNQPFWITVRTPKRAAPGVYRGELTVAAEFADGARRTASVPFAVEVFDFDLPDRMTCETGFGFSTGRIAQFHRVKDGSAEHDQVLEKYIQLLSDSHLGVYRWGKGVSPTLSWENAKDPAKAEPKFNWLEFDDAHTEMWGRFHYSAFRVPVEGLGHGFQGGFQVGKMCGVASTNDHYQALMGRYLGAFEEHLRQKGWLDTSYVYWFDEPQRKCYAFVNDGMATMKRHAPGIRRLITNECSDELDNVNLWNPRLDNFYAGEYKKYRARGDQFWWYICCGPHAPYPTEFIDHPGDELRAWLWMTWGENVRGILIWETTLWTSASIYPDKTKPQNPYVDAMSWSGSGGTWGNGDGRFVYPPLSAVETPYEKGQPAILDAPNGSYRLAILRDGIEDYEYFALLRNADPQNPLLKVPEDVYRTVRDFSSDPTAMREHRLKLAREIARLGAGAPRRERATCVGTWADGTASSYREDKWRKVRHGRKMSEIAAHGGKPYDLVLLGDSITELWEWKAPRWGTNELVKLQAKADTLALGYGGDRIQDVLYRVEHGELDGYEARHVAIMIGTNNKGCTPEDMAAGVAKLLAAVKAKQPKAKIALYATFPCRQTWRNLRNRAANALYAQVAAEAGVEFRDINEKLPLDLFPDGLHPNEKGYAIWREDLERLVSPDSVSAWVTGVRFAYGANRDRASTNPPPRLVARFRTTSGGTGDVFVASVVWKDRHFVQHRFSQKELSWIDTTGFFGLHVAGAEAEDAGIAISDVRLFRDPVTVAPNCGVAKDYPLELPVAPAVVKRIRVPFLPYGEVELLADGNFRYAYFDWRKSNASEIVFDPKTARPVARYYPKLDGTYNDYGESPVVKVSKRFEEVLPEIPNPPSEWKAETGRRVWRTHAAFDRARDKALWQMAYDHGIREAFVMDHETMWRDGGEAFTMKTEAAPGKGGDAVQREFSDFMNRTLGYWYGPYNNYTDYQPSNAKWWDVDRVTRTPDGNLKGAWLRSYSPKATRILDICERVVGEAQAKYRFRGAYCDVHTAIKPWTRTDYDPREPGAGKFRTVFESYCEIFKAQKRLWEGPVWSEGGCQFMYAGYVDGNYGHDAYNFHDRPWLVDFDVLRIHPLESDFGMGSLFHYSPSKTAKDRAFYLPHMPEGRALFLDGYIGATLAFGHTGYLILDWCWEPMKMFGPAYCGGGRECFERGMPIAMMSYYMTQAVAARYSQSTAAEIRYFGADGAALDTSAAIRTGALDRRQVYVRYANGTHVLVNGNVSERLRATVAGRACDLPPYGYCAWTEDGEVSVEVTDAGGRRTHVARCPDYEYRGDDLRGWARFREKDGSWKTVEAK